MSLFMLLAGCLVGCATHERVAPAENEVVVAPPPEDPPPPVEHREADPGDGVATSYGTWYVTWRATPDEIPLNEPFGLVIEVRDGEDRERLVGDIELSVDGRMPHHKHGMFTQPVIEGDGHGRYTVDGMLFHMIGAWQLHLDITRDGVTERAQSVIMLE